MGAGALSNIDNGSPPPPETGTDVQIGMLHGREVVRHFGNLSDLFKCQIYDQVYSVHEERLLDSPAYALLTVEQKLAWISDLCRLGGQVSNSMHALHAEHEKELGKMKDLSDSAKTRAEAEPAVEW
jgi:hypothetical protein